MVLLSIQHDLQNMSPYHKYLKGTIYQLQNVTVVMYKNGLKRKPSQHLLYLYIMTVYTVMIRIHSIALEEVGME